MEYDNLSKSELLSKIEKLEFDLNNAKNANKKLKDDEELSSQQSSILKFINSMAIPSADKSTVDEFSKVLLSAVKEYTGADLATFNLYNPEKKEIALLHFEAEDGLINTILKIAGDKIVKTKTAIDDDTYNLIVEKPVALFHNFTEATFGAIPYVLDQLIRASTGIDRMYPVAHVIEGELYGTSFLAFKKGRSSPSIEMLESYAHLISVSLRRYRMEKALNDSEVKYRTYIENAPIAILVVDGKGKYVEANPEACKLLGYTKAELLDLSIKDVLANVNDIESFSRLKKNGKLSNEIDLKKKDGRFVSIILDAILLSNNRFIAFHTDVTEHKQAEDALKISEERYRHLYTSMEEAQELSHIGSWEYILDNDTVTWSKELYKIFEIPENMPAPKYSLQSSYYSIESFAKLDNAVKQCLELEKPYEIELDIIVPSGINKQIISKGDIIKDNDNTVIGLYGIAQDITQSKKIEKELIKAKEKAEESDRLKSAFLANMSHEIRTPMNGILGFTSLLKEPGLSGEDQEKFIGIIEKSGNRMLSTINDIVDISKIESGEVQMLITEFNLNNQLDELLEFFIPEANKKKIEISISRGLEERESNFKLDQEKLNSILINIIKNAIKYTTKGSIEIGYSINKKADQKEIDFWVKDTGIGIPQNRLEAIFNRFVQADIEDRQVYEGSGLGLAISKAYVDMLGGNIWAESKLGVGSQFYFSIPFETNKPEIQIMKNNDLNITQSAKKVLKIMIVEDDDFSITYLKILLKDYAKEIIIAKTGLEALEKYSQNQDIDVILMDIKIPGINGHEATRKIREVNNEVFILAQTAYAQSGDREKAIKAGCNQYMSKPIDREKILQIISSRINLKKY